MGEKTLRPCGPQGLAYLQSMVGFQRDPFAQLHEFAGYGDVVRLPVPGQSVYLVNHPAYIKHVLVDNADAYVKTSLHPARLLFPQGMGFAHGEEHRCKRRAAQPAFHQSRMSAYANVMLALIEQHLADWQSGQPLNLLTEFKYLFRAIATQCLFSHTLGGAEYRSADPLDTIKKNLAPLDATMLGKLVNRLPLPRARHLNSSIQRLNAFFFDLIDTHRRQPQGPEDLLTMIMAAAEATGNGDRRAIDERIKDEVFNIYGASYDQTAAALTWAFYYLDRYPDTAARLHAEVDQVLAGRTPTLDDLPQLKYVRQVLAEAMRLRPVTWTLVPRVALHEDRLGDYAIPAGTMLVISPYLIHHHPAYWEEPETFRPERFESTHRKSRPYYAYIPFGGGAHRCLGESFGRMADELALATIAQRFRCRVVDGTVVTMTLVIPLAPKHGLPVILEKRTPRL